MKKKLLNTCLTFSRNALPKHPRKESYKHFSFIIQDNQIVEWGVNRSTPPLVIFGYPKYSMTHSEADAYKKAKGLLDKQKPFVVINIRLSTKGDVKNSKPCACCTNYLSSLGCKEIWYTHEGKFKVIRIQTVV